MRPITKSSKLANVCYDIRGPVLERARRMEEEGHHIIKLNIGNPATFGFDVPEEILQDVIHNLSEASGYCDSKGLFAARKAIMHYTQEKQIADVQLDDIFIGNGVSELVVLTMQALLDNGDEDVFSTGSESQDRLIRFVVPASEATCALQELDEMNINAYSLFQSEDSLFRTIGNRLFW
jgi:hypothetical protein